MIAKKIGIGIVGLGRVSQSHIDAIRLNPHICQLTAVVDVNEALAQSVAETCNTKYYTRVEQALLDPNIQAMIICLPHHLHKSVALQAMESGRHVLVEKPFATNLADGKEMVAKSIEKKAVLMAGQSFRFISVCREAKLRMKAEIGDPFNFIYIQACGFNEASAPLWWQDMKKTGGHAFTTVGSHNLDLILWMYEGRTPIRVYSEARSVNPKFEGMDEIVITISFDDESIATTHLSLNNFPELFQGVLIGPKGNICFSQFRHPRLVGVFSGELFIKGKRVLSGQQEPHNFALQMREFVDAIVQKREPMVKNRDLLTQLAILDAAQVSAETHQPITLCNG